MSVESILILIITVSFLLFIRYKKMMLVNKVFISSIVGGLGAFLPIFVSDTPSMSHYCQKIWKKIIRGYSKSRNSRFKVR